jgi:hypothetical protein
MSGSQRAEPTKAVVVSWSTVAIRRWGEAEPVAEGRGVVERLTS